MQSQSSLALIARMKGMIHDALEGHVAEDEPLAVLDFPDIRNCGDSAIWLGEMAYLSGRGKRPAYVSRMHDFSPEALERAVPEGPIFIHGGGNFGDLWVSHQDFRENMLERFEHYFLTYKNAPGSHTSKTEIIGDYGRDEAHAVLRAAHEDYSVRFADIEEVLSDELRG